MAEDKDKDGFFVYIVESPSAPDLYHGRSEGTRVSETLQLDGIPCVTRTAINSVAFTAALRIGLPEAMKAHPGRYPILHLSAHGNGDGIQLSNGDVIRWEQLRELLVPINQSLNGGLLLCMSACEGFSACQMAMEEDEVPYPYYAMVGNYGKPTWSDTAVSYLAFYHNLAKGRTVREALVAMSAASSNNEWVTQNADEIRSGYIELLKTTVEPQIAQQELETVAHDDSLSPETKALELQSTI